MEYRGVYVSSTPDCGDNEGGYYCQVYADEGMEEQIDDFCIHPYELGKCRELDYWMRTYIDDMYEAYLHDNLISPVHAQEQTM